MAKRSKYKLGMFVEVQSGLGKLSKIEAIVVDTKGYRYVVSDQNDPIEESLIISAYKAVVPRKKKEKKSEEAVNN